MQWKRTAFAFGAACAAVAATEIALESAASAATRPAKAVAVGGRRFFDVQDHLRPVDVRRGPFFGLRVQSMDVAGDAENVACFEYVCDGLRPGPQPERYEMVRTLYRVRVAPTDCDEVMGLVLPPAADLRAWGGWMGQTRWMRRAGPHGTPVGGFVGRLEIAALVGPIERPIRAFDLTLAGTTGLRPTRGNPDETIATDDGRCTAPRHDEGWYAGRVDRHALRAFAKELGDERGVAAMLRTIDRSILAGTFEGRLAAEAADDGGPSYCKIEKAAWWFDGLLAWNCKARKVQTGGEADGETDGGASADAAK